MEILLEGALSEHPVPRLLTYLYDLEQTGRLVLVQEVINKTIYIIQGSPVNVESSLRDETLGRYLVKQGRISEEDFERSVELMMKEGIQQGAALVRLGVLKPRELYQAVKEQTRAKLLSAFSFDDGQYRFYAETEFIERIYRFEFGFHSVLKEGIYLYLPQQVLEQELSKVDDGAITFLAGFEERLKFFNLNEREKEFIKAIDGKRSLGELLEFEQEYPFTKRILYLFLLCGMVGIDGRLASPIRELVPGEEVGARTEVGIIISAHAPEVVEEPEEEEEKTSPDKIMEFYMELKSKDYFQLLGIEREADDETVEKAYRSLLAQFDRSRFPTSLSAELELKLEEINTEIIKAYEALRTEERRKQYLKELQAKKEKKEIDGLKAEKFLQEGIKCVRRRDWAGAQKMFEKAVELKPDEPEYYGYLGWTIYCNPELDKKERKELAKEKILKAIKMNPNMDSAHVFLGKILKDEGKKEEAINEFKKALKCNPNCREAKRELEAHGIKVS